MIIRPEIMPEEFALGYMGRVMALSGMAYTKASVKALLEWSGNAGASRRSFSTVELLAAVAGIEVELLVRAHTTLPLRRAVALSLPEVDHGSTSQHSVLWSTALREARPGAYLCTLCIEEDLQFHGTPYWRREHQVPGLYCCTKHRVPLGYVENSSAYFSPPSAFFEDHQAIDHRWVQKLEKNEAVQRFLGIAFDLLSRRRPLAQRDVRRVAKARAADLGLHNGCGAVKRKLVSDLIKERFDTAWLASVVPGLVEKPSGKVQSSVDVAVMGTQTTVSPVVYAIVFATMFESSDEAINAMLAPHLPESEEVSPPAVAFKVSDQRLRDTYIECRGSHLTVAQKLGLRSKVARRRLQGQGLPNLGPSESSSLRNAAMAVFSGGLSLGQASKACKVDRRDLERLLIQSAGPFKAALAGISRSDRGRRNVPPRAKPTAPPRQKRSSQPAPA